MEMLDQCVSLMMQDQSAMLGVSLTNTVAYGRNCDQELKEAKYSLI